MSPLPGVAYNWGEIKKPLLCEVMLCLVHGGYSNIPVGSESETSLGIV